MQHLVDRLAAALGRSVVINDPSVVMLYSSRHFGDEDEVRVQAMLNRVAGQRGDRARAGPGRGALDPPRPDPGEARRSACGPGYCVPLRWRGDLLGLLMVIDAEDDLPAADRARSTRPRARSPALLLGERESADAAVAERRAGRRPAEPRPRPADRALAASPDRPQITGSRITGRG